MECFSSIDKLLPPLPSNATIDVNMIEEVESREHDQIRFWRKGRINLSKAFLYHKKGSFGSPANQFIVHSEPIYTELKLRTDFPDLRGPSPCKQNKHSLPSNPEVPQPSSRCHHSHPIPPLDESNEDTPPVQVILLSIPKTARAPGVCYPAEAINGFDLDNFKTPSCLHAVQLSIFDSNGMPILPLRVLDLLIPSTVVWMCLTFGAWKPASISKTQYLILV
ncbi:hypothetical protein FRC14_008172 [Serendipita sp. 396]|nr:hypothetical protein FRC14_008172 [Serendipita sp. 396]KAG8776348.1 hypothetical protein FRC15_011985 [Serendipita sp. 397]KAG8846861.1 hypothetical protein FRB91_000393 [Serendipita sp. 411]KAG8866821.1 hypothetical protein FRC20_007431 [Serendipita sp. 405]